MSQMKTDCCPTPRTDAEFARYPILDTQKHGDAVTIDFARELERELVSLREKNSELQIQVDNIDVNLEHVRLLERHKANRQYAPELADCKDAFTKTDAELAALRTRLERAEGTLRQIDKNDEGIAAVIARETLAQITK